MWTIFKVEFITILLLFYRRVFWLGWVFGYEAYGILASQLVIEQAPAALEGEVLTTQPPGKSS